VIPGFFQVDNNGWRDILRQMRVAVHEPDRGGINQVHVTRRQFAKRRLRTGRDELGKSVLALGHHATRVKTRRRSKADEIC